MRPLAIDLCCGLGGWAEGLLAEGYDVIGFDIERHVYGEQEYPAILVVQDIRTLHGSQLRSANLLVASPPCQFYSYCAMPWTKAKELAAAVRADQARLDAELELFRTCFRLQREASEAAGHHIPLIVENVRGAIPWVGRSRWNFGSYHLWGDVPALMPTARAFKSQGMNWSDRSKTGQDFTRIAGKCAIKNNGGSWFNVGSPGQKVTGQNPDGRNADGIKLGGTWFHGYRKGQGPRNHGSKSKARKAASAMIAKIPLPLSRHIAATYRPYP